MKIMNENELPIPRKNLEEVQKSEALFKKENKTENTFSHPNFTSKSIIQIDGDWYQAFRINDARVDAVSLKDGSMKRITADEYKISEIIDLSIGNLHAAGKEIPEEELKNIKGLGANVQHLNVFAKFEKK